MHFNFPNIIQLVQNLDSASHFLFDSNPEKLNLFNGFSMLISNPHTISRTTNSLERRRPSRVKNSLISKISFECIKLT